MKNRDYQAEYYDVFTTAIDDIIFYEQFITPQTSILELGCGSGRVTAGLMNKAHSVTGVDLSEAMLARAVKKIENSRVQFIVGDITTIALDSQFDLIIAPFRVFQALTTCVQVRKLFEVIRRHLTAEGTAILNVFNPKLPAEQMETEWPQEEQEAGRCELSNGDVLVMSDFRDRIDAKRQVIYPELIYRRYRNNKLINEHINSICMRYYYPDEFLQVITDNGFHITGTWGGYKDETYGDGNELVVAFQCASE